MSPLEMERRSARAIRIVKLKPSSSALPTSTHNSLPSGSKTTDLNTQSSSISRPTSEREGPGEMTQRSNAIRVSSMKRSTSTIEADDSYLPLIGSGRSHNRIGGGY